MVTVIAETEFVILSPAPVDEPLPQLGIALIQRADQL
jgi:hypothetical protein